MIGDQRASPEVVTDGRRPTLTLDTGVVDHAALRDAIAQADAHAAVVTVTDRELGSSSFEVNIRDLDQIEESPVWGEGTWGSGTWGGGPDVSFIGADGDTVTSNPMEDLLRVITSGSFPPPGHRDRLSEGQRHQLRDAMILTAHLQHARDVFVTSDLKAYIKNDRREVLTQRFRCQIMLPGEAMAWLASRRS